MKEPTRCHDCDAGPGEMHESGCDVEQCPLCGGQAISCGCEWPEEVARLPWTGEWPGSEDAKALGFFCKAEGQGWAPCGPDDPAAQPDLNRLHSDARWDAKLLKFVAATGRGRRFRRR